MLAFALLRQGKAVGSILFLPSVDVAWPGTQEELAVISNRPRFKRNATFSYYLHVDMYACRQKGFNGTFRKVTLCFYGG